MINATQIRTGMILVLEGNLYKVLTVHHVTPGKGNALMATELRDLKTGTKIDKRFRPSESVEKAIVTSREMEFLYNDGTEYHFMDTESYEQSVIDKELLGDGIYYLQPNTKILVSVYEEQPIGLELPASVDLEIVETEPPMKGATATSSYKQAKLENGVTVKVPPYLNNGDRIRVNPNTGEYIERAEKA